MREGDWTLTFTDKPRPPEPPLGHEASHGRTLGGLTAIANGFLNVVRRQVDKLGEKDEKDPFKVK